MPSFRIFGWAIFLLAGSATARGDGMMTPKIVKLGKASALVASPKQEVLLIKDGNTVQVTLRTHFRAGPEELAWIIPVPSKPSNIVKGEDALFKQLDSAAAPHFWYRESGGGGFSLGCPAAAKKEANMRVVVEETGTAGIFDYTVLQATAVDALTKWLKEHEYVVPEGAEKVLQRYVDRGAHWLAIRLRPEKSREPTLAPHPICYTYEDTQLVYPLVISRLSADKLNEIVIYVLGAGRYVCDNWENATIAADTRHDIQFEADVKPSELKRDKRSPSGTNYEQLFAQLTERKGGHVFVTEFAHDLDTVGLRPLLKAITGKDPSPKESKVVYLSRLRAIIAPAAMDRDVARVPAKTDGWMLNGHRVSANNRGDTHGAMATGLAMTVLCYGFFLYRRSRSPQRKAG